VSGVVLFAKTSKGLERLNDMLRKGEIHKTYWALTAARPPKDSDTLTDFLVRNEAQNKSYVSKNGKEARLHYTLIQTTERYFLLEIQLFTGRHHQIRCQLAHMGCPIKGDLKYGARRSNPDGGISLLARRIQFIHPVKKTEVDVTAPVPDSWKGIQG
jgi:23S rRNA pseudouridine1911/1915/1917 synthase